MLNRCQRQGLFDWEYTSTDVLRQFFFNFFNFRECNIFIVSIIFGITYIYSLSNAQTLTREERKERKRTKKTDKYIVSNKKKKGKKEAKRIERKYKTKHIHTSWYAPLDSFIFWQCVLLHYYNQFDHARLIFINF